MFLSGSETTTVTAELQICFRQDSRRDDRQIENTFLSSHSYCMLVLITRTFQDHRCCREQRGKSNFSTGRLATDSTVLLFKSSIVNRARPEIRFDPTGTGPIMVQYVKRILLLPLSENWPRHL
jgi:hypothetical protein